MLLFCNYKKIESVWSSSSYGQWLEKSVLWRFRQVGDLSAYAISYFSLGSLLLRRAPVCILHWDKLQLQLLCSPSIYRNYHPTWTEYISQSSSQNLWIFNGNTLKRHVGIRKRWSMAIDSFFSVDTKNATVKLWGFTMRWEVSSLSVQSWPGPRGLESCYHFVLSAKEGEAFTCFSAGSFHTPSAIKPSKRASSGPVRNIRMQAGELQGTDKLSCFFCRRTEAHWSMLLAGTQWLLIYRLTTLRFVSGQG